MYNVTETSSRDLWSFLVLFVKILVQVLCVGARDTLFGAELLVTDYTVLDTTALLVSTSTKL